VADPEKTTADRLTLISDIQYMRLDPPVLVRPGERYWFDWAASLLFVEDENGSFRSFPAAWPGGPDAIR
jgi:hypothetical protein